MTDRYAVIGNPVAHSKSPQIHAAFAQALGEDIEYGRLLATSAGFRPSVERFREEGGRGLNVTVPCKEEAFRYADALSDRARVAEAVNTLRFDAGRVFGDNTDGIGLVRDITRNLGVSLAGKRVLLLGAGGAARGVLAPLLAEGPASLAIANRDPAKAEALAMRFGAGSRAIAYAALEGRSFDVVINATSASLADLLPPVPRGIFAQRGLAYDMLYGKVDTPFLARARSEGVGCAADGSGMLVEQAAESYFVWRGIRPPTEAGFAALRRPQER
ncbi:MAG: shikimate dehydrogenase [Burkholderiales bacterium]